MPEGLALLLGQRASVSAAGRGWQEASVEALIGEWLSLVFRWLHVVAGIAWIGSSISTPA